MEILGKCGERRCRNREGKPGASIAARLHISSAAQGPLEWNGPPS
ncbi:hypothetical protein [Azospirillum argentinense]